MLKGPTNLDLSLALALLDKRIGELEGRIADLSASIERMKSEADSLSERVDRLVRRVLEGTVLLAAVVVASMLLGPVGPLSKVYRFVTLAALGGAVLLWGILRIGTSRLERKKASLDDEIAKRVMQLEDLEAEVRVMGEIRSALGIAHGGDLLRAYRELSETVMRLESTSEALEAILIGIKALAEGAPRDYAVKLAAGLEKRAWEQPQDSWERAAILSLADALSRVAK